MIHNNNQKLWICNQNILLIHTIIKTLMLTLKQIHNKLNIFVLCF